ncbi:HAD-IA family hydrolase [Pseudoalteromonas fenneropenaei]|uniref:HAD-IA family hydrolase n=1 Tax=Pseudoalteromonas fenneropenaei TaxID=1737459 RepID=A0ABV7CPF5_9GAMM
MMRFNRTIGAISVLSFDLDDTLYDNRPIIKAAVQAMLDYLTSLANWPHHDPHFWRDCRRAVQEQQPELEHDVSRWRQVALRFALNELGYEPSAVEQHATAAYQAFAEARSNIVVSDEVLNLLAELRQHFRLIAITNGNVEVARFNLRDQFEFVLQAGRDGQAKPAADLFIQASQRLQVAPQAILHIGDSLESDVQGANLAGCHSAWLRLSATHNGTYAGLPDAEISDVLQLRTLLTTR